MFNSDVTFSKAFPLKSERRSIMFRAEMYNIFNHTQFTTANISPQYSWPLVADGRSATDQCQPGPVHGRRQPAADVAFDPGTLLVMVYTRRDFGKLALAAAPLAGACVAAPIDSKFHGVQIGAITYSFNSIANPDPEAIIRAYVEIGLGEAELMSNHCEALAGAPRAGRGGGRGAALTPEQQAARQAQLEQVRAWRAAANIATWKGVRKKFNDAGIEVAVLCYNMNDNMKDEDIEYGFSMAEGLGVQAISTSTTLSMAKRIAPIADRHKLLVGYHGHDATNDPNQTATLESYNTLMAYGKYSGVNLDIGHFTAANYDAVAFIKAHHAPRRNVGSETPIWQFVIFPAEPVYCRATPHDALPCLRKPVSSITSTASSSAKCSMT